MKELTVWQGPNGIKFPPDLKEANELVPYAKYLSEKQKQQIVSAFQIHAYDMAAEYAWKKAMVKLKETLGTLGTKFIGELLGRDDINEFQSIDSVLTDYQAIQLAEQLGVIGPTASLKLKQANELITHYFSKDAEEEFDFASAFTIVKSSVQYVLGEQDISIALEFSNFRDRLLRETLRASDPAVEQLEYFPLFHLRTILTVLLSTIRSETGTKLDNALGNLNVIIKVIWDHISDSDRWNIGMTYRDVVAAGNTTATTGVKNALLKVNGFDFVPENLRSATFIQTAKQVLEAHFSFNNFYNEPAVIKRLSKLGSTIPPPALIECIQAYLAVYLGNSYGISIAAAPIAEEELSEISKDRWEYYFRKVVQTDDIILAKVQPRQIERFSALLKKNDLTDFEDLPQLNQKYYEALVKNNHIKAVSASQQLLSALKPNKK